MLRSRGQVLVKPPAGVTVQNTAPDLMGALVLAWPWVSLGMVVNGPVSPVRYFDAPVLGRVS